MSRSICLLFFLGIAYSAAHSSSSQDLHGLTAARDRRALLSLWSRWRRLLKDATLIENSGISKTYLKTGGRSQEAKDFRLLNPQNVKADKDGNMIGTVGDTYIRVRMDGLPKLQAYLAPDKNGKLKPYRTVEYVDY